MHIIYILASDKALYSIKNTVNVFKFQTPKFLTKWQIYANDVHPDQTALEGAVGSGSTLFAIPLCILRNSCIKNKS